MQACSDEQKVRDYFGATAKRISLMTAMTITKQKLADNLSRVRENIAEACLRVNRDPSEVTLVAVTKSAELETIRALLELGHHDLGESREQQLTQRHAMIQESLARQEEFAELNHDVPAVAKPRWHMVGHLQRNKVKLLLPVTVLIHSVDSLRLAEEINTAAAKLGIVEKVPILLQVNTSQEKQKFGLAVGAVGALAEQVETLPNLQIAGLMTMAPLTEDRNVQRFCFSRLREILEDMRGQRLVNPACKHLSMGMSQDYQVAVEEGATLVRIGSALFE